MHLEMRHYPIRSVAWGDTTAYADGHLVVHRDDLIAHLRAAGNLDRLNLVEVELVRPGTATRVVNIFDVFAARARLGAGVVDYPGVLGSLQPVGDGASASLDGLAVLALSSRADKYNKLLDLSGPGAKLTPHAELTHLALRAEPRQPDLPTADYYWELKRIGLRTGAYLARAAAAVPAPSTSRFTLAPRPQGLPRVAYVCMITSHQKAVAGEPILYGDDVSGLLPTILHPNELLDGAVVAPFWNLGIDTYTFQNNPVIQALYARHGREVDFAGVVVNVAHITRARRERSVLLIANLVHAVLGADLAVVTKVGGGIPESDLMMTVEALEQRGVKTSAVVWSHMGDGTIHDSLSSYSLAADAVASAGVYDKWVELPPQEQVIGGATVGPFSDDPNDRPMPGNGAIRPRVRDLSGAISQLGASHVAMVEI